MDGSLTPLQFPVAAPPRPGEALAIAPGVEWLRMPLPFALDHINLWLLEDGPGWTIVDTGYAMAETTAQWEMIFARGLHGLPVARIVVTHHHPDHIGLAGWLAERWQAPLLITEKEWLYARLLTRDGDDSSALRRRFAQRAGLDKSASELFGEHHRGDRRPRMARNRRPRPCARTRLPVLRRNRRADRGRPGPAQDLAECQCSPSR